MSIKVNLISSPGFVYADKANLSKGKSVANVAKTDIDQSQAFQSFQIQNGYGTATQVSVSPGFGATVAVAINIIVNTISSETFDQIINEVKNSSSYQNNSSFRNQVDTADYTAAGSSSSGIFGWLVGGGSNSYTNSSSDLTQQLNEASAGTASSDATVANSIAHIMVSNQSQVNVTATVQVTGQLLVPSPTVIAVQSTVFSFTTQDGTQSTVTMINQTPLVPVNAGDGTSSQNTVAPGARVTLKPLGS